MRALSRLIGIEFLVGSLGDSAVWQAAVKSAKTIFRASHERAWMV